VIRVSNQNLMIKVKKSNTFFVTDPKTGERKLMQNTVFTEKKKSAVVSLLKFVGIYLVVSTVISFILFYTYLYIGGHKFTDKGTNETTYVLFLCLVLGNSIAAVVANMCDD
jgi:hypothetical protein